MTERSLEALVRTIHSLYLRAYRREKTRIPAEFWVITGHHRKAAIRQSTSSSDRCCGHRAA